MARPQVRIGPSDSWHPEGRRIAVPDLAGGTMRMHVVQRGAASDEAGATAASELLLLHGFVQASWCWRDVIEPLARTRRVHAVCVPGFGWSDKPRVSYRLGDQAERLLAFLDAQGIARVDVAGCSLGGSLALELALRAPDRVRSLILINPAGAGSYPMAWLARMQHERLAPLLRLPGVPLGLRAGLVGAAYAQLPVDDRYMAHFMAPLRTDGAGEAALQVARHFNADMQALAARLDAIAAPALVIRGGRDRVIPESVVRKIQRALPGARMLRYAEAAHCPMEEDPLRFVSDVGDFLATLDRCA